METRINKILTIVISAIIFFSCENTIFEDKISSITIISAETTIESFGETKTINVQSNSKISASCEDSWLDVTVKDNMITVLATENTGIDSRHTIVSIKNDKDITQINITQLGAVFDISAGKEIFYSNDGGRNSYKLKASLGVDFTATADWISFELLEKSISIITKENSTGNFRSGYLKYESGNYIDSIKIVQGDVYDLEGIWNISYYDLDQTGEKFELITKNAELTSYADGDSVMISIIPGLLDIHCAFNNGKLIMHSGDNVGKIEKNGDTYYLCLSSIFNGNFYTTPDITSSASIEIADNMIIFDFCDSGSAVSGMASEVFGIFLFSSPDFASSSYLGLFMYFEYPILYKYIN